MENNNPVNRKKMALDYVCEGIAKSVRNQIKGIEILDKYIDNLHDSLIISIQYNQKDSYIDLIIKPHGSDSLLKFHFTELLNVKWEASSFYMYVQESRIYSECGYIVAEFDDAYFCVKCEELEVTMVDG